MKGRGAFLNGLLALAFILAVAAGKPTFEENELEDSAPLQWPSQNGYVVPKTVVNDRMRAVFAVGIEGTGHHMLQLAFSDMFERSDLPFIDACPITHQLYPGLVASLSESPLAYAQAHTMLVQNMKELVASSEKDLKGHSGTIVPLQFDLLGTCPRSGMISYPKGGGPDKPLHYVDLPLVALAAEAEGLDLRFIYLSRSAADVVTSTTQHRSFDTKGNPNGTTDPSAKSFIRYMQILLVQATLLQSMLHEVDPGFVVCQRYDSMLSDEQVTRVAEFVAPNPEVAEIFAASLKGVVHPIPSKDDDEEKEPIYEGEEVIIKRLQERFDALDASFCPPSQQ